MVKCRDFVNLRCWQLFRNGQIIEDYILNPKKLHTASASNAQSTPENESAVNNQRISLEEVNERKLQKSISDVNLIDKTSENDKQNYPALSKSLGAKDFNDDEKYLSNESLLYSDAQEEIQKFSDELKDSVYISSAISIDFPGAPVSTKYIR